MSDVTRILQSIEAGDPTAADKILQGHRKTLKTLTLRSAVADDLGFPTKDEAQGCV
jgi:hypothetical protein